MKLQIVVESDNLYYIMIINTLTDRDKKISLRNISRSVVELPKVSGDNLPERIETFNTHQLA